MTDEELIEELSTHVLELRSRSASIVEYIETRMRVLCEKGLPIEGDITLHSDVTALRHIQGQQSIVACCDRWLAHNDVSGA